MIKVSVIIPIYKVEPYVERCISSVLNQTYRMLEVILVDDCSPDRSFQLAREFIKKSLLRKDLQFKYLNHNQNCGLSAARNTGLNAASGDYFYFLDSDDEITQDCMAKLVDTALKYNKPEMVVGSINIKGHRSDMGDRVYKSMYCDNNSQIIDLYRTGIPYMMAWNKLYRSDFIKNNGFRFVEGIIHEDNPWSFFIANKLNTMVICSDITYIYYLRSDSIMSVLNGEKKLKRYNSLMAILEEYDQGFKAKVLPCNKGNVDYFTRLKYDYITEIIEDPTVIFGYKFNCINKVLLQKWPVSFISKWAELYLKIHIRKLLIKIKVVK